MERPCETATDKPHEPLIVEDVKKFADDCVTTWSSDRFDVPWSGTDLSGKEISFSDLQFYPSAEDKSVIKVEGKDKDGEVTLKGTFYWDMHFITKFQLNGSDLKIGTFEVESGDSEKKEKKLFLVVKDTPFKISMDNAVNWFNYYAGNLDVFTTITKNGIFGFSGGNAVWGGKGSWMVIRGIRNGDSYNFQYINHPVYRYNYSKKVIHNNDWCIMTGMVNGLGDGFHSSSEYFGDLDTMKKLGLEGTQEEDYAIKSQGPVPKDYSIQNKSHRVEMPPVEDEMLFRDVNAMPDSWNMQAWEEYLVEKEFSVRWQGKDSEGRDIAFEDLKISLVASETVLSGKGYVGKIDKPEIDTDLTIIYAAGKFTSGSEWTMNMKYHKNGEVTPVDVKGEFTITGEGWKNSKVQMKGTGDDEKFCLEMVDQRRWSNYYSNQNIPTFVVIGKDGIFGIGRGIHGWLGPTNYYFFKGIRKGNKFNWQYMFLGENANEVQFMYSGDALWNHEYCIIEGRVKQMGYGAWDGPFEYITPNVVDGAGKHVDTAAFTWNDKYMIEMNVPPKEDETIVPAEEDESNVPAEEDESNVPAEGEGDEQSEEIGNVF